MLGIFSFTQAGLTGAMFVMLAHGVSTGALFMLAGILYERKHTYEIQDFGGLALLCLYTRNSSCLSSSLRSDLPLLNGFVGEFLALSGAFQARDVVGRGRQRPA